MISVEEYRDLPIDRSEHEAVNGPVNNAVYLAVDDDVYWPVSLAVERAVFDAVRRDVNGPVNNAVYLAVVRAVSEAFLRGFSRE